jgi:hypothetical protein
VRATRGAVTPFASDYFKEEKGSSVRKVWPNTHILTLCRVFAEFSNSTVMTLKELFVVSKVLNYQDHSIP